MGKNVMDFLANPILQWEEKHVRHQNCLPKDGSKGLASAGGRTASGEVCRTSHMGQVFQRG